MGGNNSPCASCKLLRRRCAKDCCIFAPYFPPDDPYKFAIVHKELPANQRADAVSSLVYEANARMRDPVYGCVGAISYLQKQVSQLQMQLAVAQAEILCFQMQPQELAVPMISDHHDQRLMDDPDDDGSFFLCHDNPPHQFLGFASPSSNVSIQDYSPGRESLFGHDMVSS
ncbi:hypothetical protein RHSIM_Rhsim09G0180200 [Rhododendron simsii]|uniref:LOB domain-containing protein n=1 Tax=Rhododendron simsii TaxID=118357 RepID=A0A834GDQ4_RHOSS|nr:hypothetical protein RHSIM_Rhsim09G0180200 [Rhododendron simsii]